MNQEIIDSDQSIKMKPSRKPIHLSIVSIGAFLLITLVLLIMMDLFVTALTEELAIVHAGFAELPTDEPIPTIVTAVRTVGIVCLAISIWFGLLGEKMYLHRPGRILQKVMMVMVVYLVLVMFGIGIAAILGFAFFFWSPSFLANWEHRELTIYRGVIIGILLSLMFGEYILSLGIGLLGIFAIFFWQPKAFSEWSWRNLTLFRALIIMLVVVPVGFEMILTGISLSFRAPFGTAFSAYLTSIGAGIISVAPALLLAIPLYLYLPKIIRDVWNLRPNIETFWREFLYHKMGIVGLIIIGAIVIMALFAPYIAPYYWRNPLGSPILLDDLLQPPSPEHILGTNHRGEDIFSRVIYGSQISLLIGFAASATAIFLGTAIGLISGYYGGIIDVILMRITDVFLCLPTLPLMLIFLVMFGQGLQNVIVVIAILGWTGTARMVRSEALSLRERPLTEAAHALGASDGYILIHHILPNTLPLILANMILGVVNAILSEAGIAFLGFVDIHGQPSWGIILHWAWKNAALLANKWWWFIPPGLLIMLTTLGFVFISHTADKVVNPRLRGRRQ